MEDNNYLRWLVHNTKTTWWHDSADPTELDQGLENGATGVTTNPVLTNRALADKRSYWDPIVKTGLSEGLTPEQKAEFLMKTVVTKAARKLEKEFERSEMRLGYVCAQVNPAKAGDRQSMLAMARRFSTWAPNIAVKLPVTAAGLDVLETCVSEGISVTATVSFTVPQVIAIAQKYHRGIELAEKKGKRHGKCFAVIMIGRLDDYLRDVAHDGEADIDESDITQAGLAVTKRAYSIYREKGYKPLLIIAALRGSYHMTELAGAELIMSIHPKYQQLLLSGDTPREERIDREVSPRVIERLSVLHEFRRSYLPDGMKPEEFLSFGPNQRTLTQFSEIGWKPLENFEID
ncbi:MAG: transaldolase family protein [Spirochaetes bacterium]|nr:transaldolase family protein [Spirochaetota bacterium]